MKEVEVEVEVDVDVDVERCKSGAVVEVVVEGP